MKTINENGVIRIVTRRANVVFSYTNVKTVREQKGKNIVIFVYLNMNLH